MSNKRVSVIGAGFAALTAIRTIRAHDKNCQIAVIAPKAEFVYLPSLIWIPSGLRSPESLVVPLNNYFYRNNIDNHSSAATGLKDDGRTVVTEIGDVANDGLIIACGGQFIKKLPGIEHAILPCEGTKAAVEIRDRIRGMQGGTIAIGFSGNPKEPTAMRGGPMFEFLFGIDTMLRKEGRRDKFKLVFFSPAPKPGQRLGPRAMERLLGNMEQKGIITILGSKIKAFEAKKVITEDGEFDADLILFMPGMTGNKWFNNTDLPRSEGGLIRANEYCQVDRMKRTYVAGDAGSFPGPDWMPKQAHMADLQAKAAAVNLLDELAGKNPRQTYKVELMCIVDSLDKGMLVVRTSKRNISLGALRMAHWFKRLLEWFYLRKYR